MLLRRVGAKHKLAKEIIKYFPEHNLYIELFFGAGGLFFNKPLARHNILNDIDEDVYNLYQVLKTNPELLEEELKLIPFHEKIFKDFKKNNINLSPVMRAVRFIYLSNYSYLGISDTLRFISDNSRKVLISNIEKTLKFINLSNIKFTCSDFRKAFKNIAIRKNDEPFIYADPPYINTSNNYSDSFTEQDTKDLFELLVNSKIKFAISEFKCKFVLDLVEKYGLNVVDICERQTLKSRNTEILVMNYSLNNQLF